MYTLPERFTWVYTPLGHRPFRFSREVRIWHLPRTPQSREIVEYATSSVAGGLQSPLKRATGLGLRTHTLKNFPSALN